MDRPSGDTTSHPFTCNTCQVAFRSSELQRTHMQSDWHRYNLKRRVASLPPLTSDIFAEKVLATKASAAATAARASFEKTCSVCRRTYFSENAYQNHLGSQKHKISANQHAQAAGDHENESEAMMSSTFSLGSPLETGSTATESSKIDTDFTRVVEGLEGTSLRDGVPENGAGRPGRTTQSSVGSNHEATSGSPRIVQSETMEERPAVLQCCLFCNLVLADLNANLSHMEQYHGLFIPEREFLVDLEGLIMHLHEKITIQQQCLFCQQFKHTAQGVQAHMREKGHCMIPFESEAEMLDIGAFYDFRSTYSDAEEESDADREELPRKTSAKLGTKRTSEVVVTAENGDEPDEMIDCNEDDWESDSTLSSVPTEEITALPISDFSHRYKDLDKHRHHTHKDPRPHHNYDGYHSHAHTLPHAVYYDETELHLPTGRIAGHRSLNRYYRQNLRDRPTPEEQAMNRRVLTSGSTSSDTEMQDAENDSPQQERNDRQLVTRANGGMGMVGVTEAKKREVKAVEKREQKRQQRAETRYRWGNEWRANNQKHFRDPLLQ